MIQSYDPRVSLNHKNFSINKHKLQILIASTADGDQ
jgi:hypothetical protein